MATTAVQVAPGLPTSKPAQISSKREFEKIILDICRLATQSRKIAGEHMEVLLQQSEKITQSQTKWHFAGSVVEIITGLSSAALTGYLMGGKADNIPNAFQVGSKVGEVFKSIISASQYSDQMKKEKVQHANQQWQTWANGLQDLIRNLESGKQRLQQMEDATNR
jgi:hypothetical protein